MSHRPLRETVMNRYIVAGISFLSLAVLPTLVLWTASPSVSDAHCQVPCGIYDDAARIKNIREDATTIAKAIAHITDMASHKGKDTHNARNINQTIRWVITKEEHASHIIEVVSQYFLTQKVKPVARGADGYDAYLSTLADHHAVMSAAMKCKQNADPATVTALNKAVDVLAGHY